MVLPGAVLRAPATASARLPDAHVATLSRCRDLFRRKIPQIPTGFEVSSLATADFDRDGRDDIVYVDPRGVTVLLSQADGRFSAPLMHAVGFQHSLVVGDLNRDARPDVVLSGHSGNALIVLLGDGTGRFAERARPELPENASVRAIADFDDDGNSDVLATAFGRSDGFPLHVLLGDGTGGLARVAGSRPDGGLAYPTAVGVGDFDGDAIDDVVVGGLAGMLPLTLLHGDGAGGFSSMADASVFDGPVGDIAVADFDHDGRSDIGVADWVPGSTRLLVGDGSGRFRETRGSGATIFDSVMGVISTDFNRDGNADLANMGSSTGEIFVWLGDGRGRLRPAPGSPEWGGRYAATEAVSGDFDGDGRADLVGASKWQRTLRVLMNTGGARQPGSAQAIRFIKASAIAPGGWVRLVARLRCHPGKLDLFRRPHRRPPGGRWTRIARIDTDFRGNATYDDQPRVSAEYQWRPTSPTRLIKPTRRRVVRVMRGERRTAVHPAGRDNAFRAKTR